MKKQKPGERATCTRRQENEERVSSAHKLSESRTMTSAFRRLWGAWGVTGVHNRTVQWPGNTSGAGHLKRQAPLPSGCAACGRHQASEDKVSFTANFPALKRVIIPLKKVLGSPKVKGGTRVSTAVKISQSSWTFQRVRVMTQGVPAQVYLGSSMTPLLRSVILGYFTFFWSSSF